jgi:hypothetical protein
MKDTDLKGMDMSELEYRRALKALPREIEPERDLWSGIAARIQAPVAKRRQPQWMRYAVAAGFTFTALALGMQLGPWSQSTAPLGTAQTAQASPWVLREAELLKVDLNSTLNSGPGAELAAIARAPDQVLSASLKELDSAEDELDRALRQNPDSTFLLDRMRRVQQQKTRLTLRALAA